MSAHAGPAQWFKNHLYVLDGLQLYFDASTYSGSGTTVTDLSGNGRNGTLYNGPTWSSAGGGSFVLDGTNDYIGAPIGISGTDATVEVLAKLTTVTNRVLFSLKTDTYQTSTTVGPDIYVSGTTWCWNTGDGAANAFSASPTWNTSTFNHIVVTNALASNAKLYVNGALVGTAGYRNCTTTGVGDRFALGTWFGGTSYETPGNYCVARVYNRALTSDEVTQNYNNLLSRMV